MNFSPVSRCWFEFREGKGYGLRPVHNRFQKNAALAAEGCGAKGRRKETADLSTSVEMTILFEDMRSQKAPTLIPQGLKPAMFGFQ
jgi:hypothetical protein